MTEIEFKRRTQRLALEVIRFEDALPRSRSADVLTGQILCSATVSALRREAEETLAMTVASLKTLRTKTQANPESKI